MCDHEMTKVINSATPGVMDSNGYARLGNVDYQCFAIRRRQCLDCKERFTTVEVVRGLFEELQYQEDRLRKKVVADIADFLEQRAKGSGGGK